MSFTPLTKALFNTARHQGVSATIVSEIVTEPPYEGWSPSEPLFSLIWPYLHKHFAKQGQLRTYKLIMRGPLTKRGALVIMKMISILIIH